MRYIIEVDAAEQERIQALLRSGKYPSVQDFIQVALQNQLYIEQQELSTAEVMTTASTVVQRPAAAERGLGLEYLRHLSSDEIRTIQPPAPAKLYLDEPIWGLANRLFPVKITMRVLANMLRNGETHVPLNELYKNAFDVACWLEASLEKSDNRENRKRGNRLSDALPARKNEKSRGRFESQFVGGLTQSTGKLQGALAQLQFIDIVGNPRSLQVGLTQTGVLFAALQNPVIDRHEYTGPAFSPAESEFVVQHIFENLAGEARGISFLLSAASKGDARPADFDAVVKGVFHFNDTVTTTLRVGLVGRMTELGMLGREHMGVEVTYHLEKFGEETMKRFAGQFLQAEAK